MTDLQARRDWLAKLGVVRLPVGAAAIAAPTEDSAAGVVPSGRASAGGTPNEGGVATLPDVPIVGAPDAPADAAGFGSQTGPAMIPPPQSRQPTLHQGDSNPDGWVEYLQQQLGVKADGKFGPGTQAAVLALQKKNGLTADGIVGNQTWAALRGARPKPPDTGGHQPATGQEAGTVQGASGNGRAVTASEATIGADQNAAGDAEGYSGPDLLAAIRRPGGGPPADELDEGEGRNRDGTVRRKPGDHGRWRSGESKGDQDAVFDEAVKEHGLTPDEARELHDEISGMNYDRDTIRKIAGEIADRGKADDEPETKDDDFGEQRPDQGPNVSDEAQKRIVEILVGLGIALALARVIAAVIVLLGAVAAAAEMRKNGVGEDKIKQVAARLGWSQDAVANPKAVGAEPIADKVGAAADNVVESVEDGANAAADDGASAIFAAVNSAGATDEPAAEKE